MAVSPFNITLPLRQRITGRSTIDFEERQHRGRTSDTPSALPEIASENGRFKCSIRYILTLLLELKKTRAHDLLYVSKCLDDNNHVRRLQFLAFELSRLLEWPDLFPSAKIRARFLAILGADGEFEFSKACKALLLQRELRNIERIWRAQFTRKPYMAESSGWENFLLDGAPGSGFTTHCTIPKSVLQVVPVIGMRVLADYEREEAEIVHFVQESTVPLDVLPAATTLMIDFDNPTAPDQYVPDIGTYQESRTAVMRPNPFRNDHRQRLDLVTPGSEDLQLFSSLIHRLEFPPPPMNAPAPLLNGPNVCPIVTLRSWHPPTTRQELRALPQE